MWKKVENSNEWFVVEDIMYVFYDTLEITDWAIKYSNVFQHWSKIQENKNSAQQHKKNYNNMTIKLF